MKHGLASVLALCLAVVGAWAVSRVPEALSKVEAFRISEIRLEGNRFLTPSEAAKSVAISPLASIWDDFDVLEERLRTHPLVDDVKAKRGFPRALVLEVKERQPVALVPNPTLEPVDDSGRFLPIDPAVHHLDLPIIRIQGRPGDEALSAAERRLLAGEISRLGQGDPDFLARISEIDLDPRGDLWVQFWRRDDQGEVWDLPVTLHFPPSLPNRRVREGLRVLDDAMTRFDGSVVADLDLRYEDQVVVRLKRAQGN